MLLTPQTVAVGQGTDAFKAALIPTGEQKSEQASEIPFPDQIPALKGFMTY